MTQVLEIRGERFYLLDKAEYDRLARGGAASNEPMPGMPEALPSGNLPAIEAMRASLARRVIQARQQARSTQAELARRAGVRVETLNRLERGLHMPSERTFAKIDLAIQRASRGK